MLNHNCCQGGKGEETVEQGHLGFLCSGGHRDRSIDIFSSCGMNISACLNHETLSSFCGIVGINFLIASQFLP